MIWYRVTINRIIRRFHCIVIKWYSSYIWCHDVVCLYCKLSLEWSPSLLSINYSLNECANLAPVMRPYGYVKIYGRFYSHYTHAHSCTCIHMLQLSSTSSWGYYIHGLMQKLRNSNAIAMELRPFCIKPMISRQLYLYLWIRSRQLNPQLVVSRHWPVDTSSAGDYWNYWNATDWRPSLGHRQNHAVWPVNLSPGHSPCKNKSACDQGLVSKLFPTS